jgi:hypothetical protein
MKSLTISLLLAAAKATQQNQGYYPQSQPNQAKPTA